MRQIWHFYDHDAVTYRAWRNGESSGITAREGDQEVVLFLNEQRTRDLIAQLQATLPKAQPAAVPAEEAA